MLHKLVLVILLLAAVDAEVLDCHTFNASKIELITFDVFAALMDLFPSLERNVGHLLPTLQPSLVQAVVYDWVSFYGSLAGRQFNPMQTNNEEPFVWMARTGLVWNTRLFKAYCQVKLIERRNLTKLIPINGTLFNSLLGVWGNLVPWNNTVMVVSRLAKHYKGEFCGLLLTATSGPFVEWRYQHINPSYQRFLANEDGFYFFVQLPCWRLQAQPSDVLSSTRKSYKCTEDASRGRFALWQFK